MGKPPAFFVAKAQGRNIFLPDGSKKFKRNRKMKSFFLGMFFLPAGCLFGQTFDTLHNFGSNGDGTFPSTDLIILGNAIYGTTPTGGALGGGMLFKLAADGSGYTNLQNFPNTSGGCPIRLITNGTLIYGFGSCGGSFNYGQIFTVSLDGAGITNLHSFTASTNFTYHSNGDGLQPSAVILMGTNLFGTASSGGSFGNGVIFRMNQDGTGFTNLYSFTLGNGPLQDSTQRIFNGDGAQPTALTCSGNVIYGATYTGGAYGNGALFSINPDGSGFTNLHSFGAGTAAAYSLAVTNAEGARPNYGLLAIGGTLYGTTSTGGNAAKGAIYKINCDGSGFTNLHLFTALFAFPTLANSDGATPSGGLTYFNRRLYGLTTSGGLSGNGSIYSVNPDGTDFRSIYSFSPTETAGAIPANYDGAYPADGLAALGAKIFGVASGDGAFGDGTIFSFSFAPVLAIAPFSTNIILSWPTNTAGFDYSGFALQSTTNLMSPGQWNPVTNRPLVLNGRFTVTNIISETQMFYRLSN